MIGPLRKKILELLTGEDENTRVDPVSDILNDVPITAACLKKIRRYSELVMEEKGSASELYGILTRKSNCNEAGIELITHSFLAFDQRTSAGSVEVAPGGVLRTFKNIGERGYHALGWWHSHGNFSTFHSGTDDKNLLTVLDLLAPHNQLTVYRKISTGENVVALFERIKSNCSDAEAVEQLERHLKTQKLPVGFAYSIVVNAGRGVPYAEIGLKRFCGSCYHGDVEIRRRVPVTVVKTENAEVTEDAEDEEQMRAEIRARVEMPRTFSVKIGSWPGGRRGGIDESSWKDRDYRRNTEEKSLVENKLRVLESMVDMLQIAGGNEVRDKVKEIDATLDEIVLAIREYETGKAKEKIEQAKTAVLETAATYLRGKVEEKSSRGEDVSTCFASPEQWASFQRDASFENWNHTMMLGVVNKYFYQILGVDEHLYTSISLAQALSDQMSTNYNYSGWLNDVCTMMVAENIGIIEAALRCGSPELLGVVKRTMERVERRAVASQLYSEMRGSQDIDDFAKEFIHGDRIARGRVLYNFFKEKYRAARKKECYEQRQ